MSVPARLIVALVRGYQFFSRRLPNHCRYWPTCSTYAAEAVASWGAARGTWLAVRRIGRCHPWGGHGVDPVPEPPPHRHRRARRPTVGTTPLARTPLSTK